MANTRGLSLRQELADMGFEEEAIRRFVQQYGILAHNCKARDADARPNIQQFIRRIKERNVNEAATV